MQSSFLLFHATNHTPHLLLCRKPMFKGNKKGVKPSFVNPYFLIRRLVKALDQIRDEHFTPMREPVVSYSRSSRLPVFD